jgi:hypothetical protein
MFPMHHPAVGFAAVLLVIVYSGRSMASALLKTCSIMGRIGQRCDQRIEAQPMTMRSLPIGAYPSTPPGGSSWLCSTYGAHPDLVAVEGAFHSLQLGRSRWVRRGGGELLAWVHRATLATRNSRDFDDCGLQVVNPYGF